MTRNKQPEDKVSRPKASAKVALNKPVADSAKVAMNSSIADSARVWLTRPITDSVPVPLRSIADSAQISITTQLLPHEAASSLIALARSVRSANVGLRSANVGLRGNARQVASVLASLKDIDAIASATISIAGHKPAKGR